MTKPKKITYPKVHWVTSTIDRFRAEEGYYYLEDIPNLSSDNIFNVENIFHQIASSSYGSELYPSLESKAAWIFYCFCKNHPLNNGNKRMAVLITCICIVTNTHSPAIAEIVKILNIDLYLLAIDTVQTDSNDFKKVHQELTTTFKRIVDELGRNI
jgi:prophage maintenance system killer protein